MKKKNPKQNNKTVPFSPLLTIAVVCVYVLRLLPCIWSSILGLPDCSHWHSCFEGEWMHLLVSPMYVRKWLLYKTADSNRGEVPHSQKERRWFPFRLHPQTLACWERGWHYRAIRARPLRIIVLFNAFPQKTLTAALNRVQTSGGHPQLWVKGHRESNSDNIIHCKHWT